MKPSIGRIVHYQAFGTPGGEYKSLPRAALITAADELGPEVAKDPLMNMDEKYHRVALCIVNPTGLFFNLDVKFDESGAPGTWRWPPRG